MKKLAIVLFVSLIIIACRFGDGNINITHSQYSHYYEMTARFSPDKTERVDHYLDKELAGGSMSFVNTRIDGDIALDDKTNFYIRKKPGYLKIKFDKEKNSEEAYLKIRSVLEGINEVVR